jgi:hypothetical protein
VIWLGWAYLAKKMPHAATTPIATAFKICMSHRKKWALQSPAGTKSPDQKPRRNEIMIPASDSDAVGLL